MVDKAGLSNLPYIANKPITSDTSGAQNDTDTPITQGQVNIKVQTETIDVATAIQQIQSNSTSADGAFVYFTGMVRDFVDGSGTSQASSSLYLEYYPGMCEREIKKICLAAKHKWQVNNIDVIHRVGDLKVGEPIVFIGISSTHRNNAFKACEYIIDTLKTQAPFWKQEKLADGSKFWVVQSDYDANKADQWKL